MLGVISSEAFYNQEKIRYPCFKLLKLINLNCGFYIKVTATETERNLLNTIHARKTTISSTFLTRQRFNSSNYETLQIEKSIFRLKNKNMVIIFAQTEVPL